MAPDQQDAPPPPRRTLADLPHELKAIIARMAQDQDLAFKQRVCLTLTALGETEGEGRSAPALALVDRAWRSAVMPFIFETMASDGCAKDVFAFRIAPKFGRFVKRAIFRQGQQIGEDWTSLLRALPYFVNLEHVTFAYSAGLHLFNTEGEPTAPQATYRDALHDVAHSVTSLRLEWPSPDALAWMLPMFTNLRRFELTMLAGPSDPLPSEDSAVLHALARCNKLKHLSLAEEMEPLLEAFVMEPEGALSWPKGLRSLVLRPDGFGTDAWRFIPSFKDNLECLTLRVGWDGLLDDLADDTKTEATPPTFARLHRLRVDSRDASVDIIPLLALFSTSPIRHIELAVGITDYPAEPPTPAVLEAILQLFPIHLRTVHLNYRPIRNIRTLHAISPTLISLAAARNITLTLGPTYDVFHHGRLSEAVELDDSLKLRKSRHDIEEVLRFGAVQAEGLETTQDVVGMERLLEALKPLKESMMKMRD